MPYNQKAIKIVQRLHEYYPDADCTLNFDHSWQLLIAAVLAAQCTDARVNIITEKLFVKYSSLGAFAAANQQELEEDIRSCGLFRNKAKAIIASSKALIKDHEGIVPEKFDELIALPGVGRKIANLILGDSFGVPSVVVDTHCARITRLLGLSHAQEPVRIEQDIAGALPPRWWISWGHLMVAHGRAICKARSPQCSVCPVCSMCAYAADTGQACTEADL